MPDQMQFPGMEAHQMTQAEIDSLDLTLQGHRLIADNWDVMLIPQVRGETRHEGYWIVCSRRNLTEYVQSVSDRIKSLEAEINRLKS